MTIDISDNNPRISYTVAAGVTQTSFAVPFEFFANTDLNVYVNGVLKTITTDYTVIGGEGSTGTVTISVTGPATVTLTRDTTIERVTDFPTGIDINRAALNTQLDTLTAISADVKDLANRSIRVNDFDLATGLELPSVAKRADKLLKFDTDGNVVVESASALASGAVVGANFVNNSFIGDGAQTVFTTTVEAGSKNNAQVYIDGVYQLKSSFSVSGTALTFTEAPPLNSQIEVIIGKAIDTLDADSGNINYNQGAAGAQTRTVENKLQEFVSVKDFGAVGDGVTDDTAAIQAAADYCVSTGRALYAPAGFTFYIENSVDLRAIKYIDFKSDISVNASIVGVPVTVGGLSSSIGGSFFFADVSDGNTFTAPARPIFRVFGAKAATINLGNCPYMQLYADAAVTGGTSTAYNTIHLNGVVYKVELLSAAGFSWINENFIYGGRINKLIVDGPDYGHNHNKFFNNTFEGSDTDIQFLGTAHVNQIYGARFENVSGSAGVTFGSNTYSNTIIQTWSGTGNPSNQFKVGISVSDSGEGNLVITEASHVFDRELLFDISPSSKIVANATDSSVLAMSVGRSAHQNLSRVVFNPSLQGVSFGSFGTLGLSDYIPVQLGDCFGFNADYDGSLLRCAVYIYDADMKPITSEGAGGAYISLVGSTFSSTDGRASYRYTTNLSAAGLNQTVAAVIRPEVKYVQIEVSSGSAGFIRSAQAVSWTRPINGIKMAGASLMRTGPAVLDGAPTKGFVPYGSQILDISTSPATLRYVSYAYETVVFGALAAGATSVTVMDQESIANGDIVGILLDNKTTHWTTVSSLSGSTFTIDAIPAGRSVADRSRITFNRWAT